MEESKKNIYQRIVEIMREMGAIGKTGRPDGGAGYAYHRIDDIDDRLRQALIAHGVIAFPADIEDRKIEYYVDEAKGGRIIWYAEVVLRITLVNADNPEERVTIVGWGQGVDFSDKATGKAYSYAAKAAYLTAFHLRGQPDSEQDSIERPASGKGQSRPKKPANKDGAVQITEKQMQAIMDIRRASTVDELNIVGERIASDGDDVRTAIAVRAAWAEASKRLRGTS